MAPAQHLTFETGEQRRVRLSPNRAGGAQKGTINVRFGSPDLMYVALRLIRKGFTLKRLTFTDLHGQPRMLNHSPLEKKLRNTLETEGVDAVFALANDLMNNWRLSAIEVECADKSVYNLLNDGSVYVTTLGMVEQFIQSVEEYLKDNTY